MKVLVVGGTRFMGVATVERLLEHAHDVTIFNRGTRPNPWPGRVRALTGDRTDPRALGRLAGELFDAIVDFCAYDADDASGLLGIQGEVPRLVHISSGTVYRLDPRLPWAEDTPYGPAELWGEYARGKIECERVLRSGRAAAAATTAIRFPWVLGPGSYADRERFVLNRLLDGQELLLPGDGQAPQQFLSAEQAAEAVVGAVETFDGGGWRAFNIASPGHASLEEFVHVCASVARVEPRFRVVGGGPTGTGGAVFDIRNCVFPYPNSSYLLDLSASEQAGIAPRPIALEATIEASLGELRANRKLRDWRRTTAELAVIDAR